MTRHWKYTWLLISIIALLILNPLIDHERIFELMYTLMLACVFGGLILILFHRPKSRLIALILGVPTMISTFTFTLFPTLPPSLGSLIFHLLPAGFLGYAVVVLLRSIFRNPGISTDSINGAFCGYLLLGLTFGHLYCLIELYRPGSFNLEDYVGGLPDGERRRHALLSYFSLVTLTTVGYGDIVPRHGTARSVACIEAVIGQFYVGVVVAELLALKVSTVLNNRFRQEDSHHRQGERGA